MSSTLTPYKNSTQQTTFTLASENPSGQSYLVSGRSINKPFRLEVIRKLTTPGASGNDSIVLRLSRVEANATSGKLATLSASLIISIPKDTSVLDATAQKELVTNVGSLIFESTAAEATNVFVTALIEGRNP